MVALSFATLPTDILVLVLRHLGVYGILALRQSCKALEALTRSRTVWHDALHAHVLARGLPLPGLHARPLSTLTAVELEKLTLRALALLRNWTSAHPRSTRSIELVPPGIPAGARARNLAVHYLPGREGRYLLTITFYDEPAAPRKVVATLRCMNLTGANVNTDPNHPGILAITQRWPSDAVTTCIFSIDFSVRDPHAPFLPLQEFASFRFPLALEGSVFAASGPDNIVRVIDVEAGCVRAALRVPHEHDDPTLRNEDQRCMGAVFLPRHVLTFCRQWIHLYELPPVPPTIPPNNALHAPPAACDPLASHKWQWRIDSLVVASRLPACDAGAAGWTRSGGEGGDAAFPSIDVLIRFDTWFPWPVNILHHTAATPYLHADGAPTMAHSIPSPIRLFTPSDMVLGRRGTALWLDAQAYDGGPAQAGDHGQRVAGKVLPVTGALGGRATGEGEGAVGEEGEPDRWHGEERAQTMTFHMQEDDDGWNKLALDEEEGRVAVGTVDGRVHLFEYAPGVEV
ncbi:uncharacterized protein B0H18DRAFT_1210872 [Fomitopsis serialis]|uniref:uncharacterized protein n=1 Tax=Fomitopsis serialis TaxID=139415 RepID=UPI0020081846|nr:uncharacterized protein B0H18DRAFT_1210872 [Neoantrodia serialis]KAH9926982.1 hypothetical protein B0H18DRAFT_1210872 [Neoantrodia serialis]